MTGDSEGMVKLADVVTRLNNLYDDIDSTWTAEAAIEAAVAEVRGLARTSWNTSMDEAPRDGTRVLLYREPEVYVACWHPNEVMGPVWATPDGHVIFKATAWMHLPPPPDKE